MQVARPAGIGATERLRELFRYRELVVNLTVRDLRVKYRRSTLGIAWSLLNPLLMMAIYTAVFSVFLRFVSIKHYWAFVLVGILVWGFFSNSVSAAAVSYMNNAGLITKLYFPVESLPISITLAQFVNLLISMVVLLVVLIVGGIPLGPSIVLLPVILAAQLAFTVGIGLIAASVTVFLRDLEHFVGLGLTVWFYLTPIIYPLDPQALPHAAGAYLPYFRLNPLTWYVESYHAVLFFGTWPDPAMFTLMLVSAAVALGAGYLLFVRLRSRLPEEV
jgi:ABC-2 type transport system permease protein